MRNLWISTLAMLFVGCGTADPGDDFSDLANLDEKSDAFSSKMKVVGTLAYGETSARTYYSGTPRYRAFKFTGAVNDMVDVQVRSDDGGDAVAWITDATYHVLAKSDDGKTTDARLTATLPANTKATNHTYIVIFREQTESKAHFFVTVKTDASDFNACKTDADCVAVPRVGCCNNGWNQAVNKSEVDAYEQSFECPDQHPICPLYVVDDTRVALCNVGTQRCEMVQPQDVRCGGFTVNPHACPKGWQCKFNGVPDVPGTCVQAPNTDKCGGCGDGKDCSYCWGHWACIPHGAQC